MQPRWGKGETMGQEGKELAMSRAPGVPESLIRSTGGKRDRSAPNSNRLVWSCPLLPPWEARECFIRAMGLLKRRRSCEQETPRKKEGLHLRLCLFSLFQASCALLPFPEAQVGLRLTWKAQNRTELLKAALWQMMEASKPPLGSIGLAKSTT